MWHNWRAFRLGVIGNTEVFGAFILGSSPRGGALKAGMKYPLYGLWEDL